MSRPVSAVHVDIARFVLEVSRLSAESAESTERLRGAWVTKLAESLAMRDPEIHPYGKHLLSEVEEYRKAELERKRAKFSALSAESAERQPRTDQSKAKQSNTEQKRKKREEGASRFVPPILAEVQAYCSDRKSPIDPESFIAHYTSNGWRVGPNPMRSWKAAIITWEKKHGQAQNAGRGQRGTFATAQGPGSRRDAKADREFPEQLDL